MARALKNDVDDDLDDMDMFDDADLDLDLDRLEKEASSASRKSGKNSRKRGASLHRMHKGPDIWDDDWVDPADDLMYGFEDEPGWDRN